MIYDAHLQVRRLFFFCDVQDLSGYLSGYGWKGFTESAGVIMLLFRTHKQRSFFCVQQYFSKCYNCLFIYILGKQGALFKSIPIPVPNY